MSSWLTKLLAVLRPDQTAAVAPEARREPQLRPGQGSSAPSPERDALIRQAIALTAQKQHIFAELDAKTQAKFLTEAAQMLGASARRNAAAPTPIKKAQQ